MLLLFIIEACFAFLTIIFFCLIAKLEKFYYFEFLKSKRSMIYIQIFFVLYNISLTVITIFQEVFIDYERLGYI